MPSTPQFLYFDLGNVLLRFDPETACRQMGEVAGVSSQRVRQAVYEGGLQQRYEMGEISSREFHDQFCHETGTRPEYLALKHAGSAMFELNELVLPLLRQLAAQQFRMGILSNTCEAHWQYISSGRFPFVNDFFTEYVLSFRVGAMKPAVEIYRQAANQARVSPNGIFFTDDRPENVAAAVDAGFDSVLFTSSFELAGALRLRGIPLDEEDH
jgi:putative hydrolase of the HAD superfamily